MQPTSLVEFMQAVADEADADTSKPVFQVMNAVMTKGLHRKLPLGLRERFWRDVLMDVKPNEDRAGFGNRMRALCASIS